MTWRIDSTKDSKRLKILKICYLIPTAIILYFPCVIYLGMKEVGNPISQFIEILKDVFKKEE